MMTDLFEVKKVEGKGLGCFAIKDIKRGTLILKEAPQIEQQPVKLDTDNETIETFSVDEKGGFTSINPFSIMNIMISFNGMNKKDQREYLKLYKKSDNFQPLPVDLRIKNNFIHLMKVVKETKESDQVQVLKQAVEDRSGGIKATDFIMKHLEKLADFLRKNNDPVEKVFKVMEIFETNNFHGEIRIKSSRFNHSCQPNAAVLDPSDVRAMSKIRAGEEITISYDPRVAYLKRQERQQFLFPLLRCSCSCIFCQEDGEDENDLAFYEEFAKMEKEVKKLISDREDFLKHLETFNGMNKKDQMEYLKQKTHLHEQSYPSSKCRMEVDLHRKMYKLGKEKSVTPTFLYESLENGIDAAICGISNAKKEGNQESQKAFLQDCKNFLKTAKNFENILGNDRLAQSLGCEIEEFKELLGKLSGISIV